MVGEEADIMRRGIAIRLTALSIFMLSDRTDLPYKFTHPAGRLPFHVPEEEHISCR